MDYKNSEYRVRHTKKYLKHICEEIRMVVKVGRNNFGTREEAVEVIGDYLKRTKGIMKDNSQRTDLDLAIEWAVMTLYALMQGRGTGDLVPMLSLAKKAITGGKNVRFEWVEMKPYEAVYFSHRKLFISQMGNKKFKY